MNYNTLDRDITYLVTGAAGFIGYHLACRLLKEGCRVVGIDNLNHYYDVKLKNDRLKQLNEFERFTFLKIDISEKEPLNKIFEKYRPKIVVNLAAQAGVRYSITNPDEYIQSNLIGFYNVLECCRQALEKEKGSVEHLFYASSSSVYGNNMKVPFSVEDKTDDPVSLYAATKKSNELMASAYSNLFNIPTTGLRFFTVYGPMGRPDMAYFKFTKKIFAGETIDIFNNGEMKRDFTFVDDVIEIVVRLMCSPERNDHTGARHKVFNVGNNHPEHLMHYITVLENVLSKVVGEPVKANKRFLPMQPGDVLQTYADCKELEEKICYTPVTSIEEGLGRFADWYCDYYKVKKAKTSSN